MIDIAKWKNCGSASSLSSGSGSGGAPIPSLTFNIRIIGVNLDGLGMVLTTGQKGYIRIPYSAVITGWDIIADVAGTCVFDIWKKAGVKPTVVDTITGASKPTLAGTDIASSTTLTGWNVNINANDYIGWNLDSVTVVTSAILQLTLRAL
jgi:hypothetical protein